MLSFSLACLSFSDKEVAAFMYVNPYWGIAANAWIAFGNDHDSRTGGDFDGNENWFGLLTYVLPAAGWFKC